MNIYSEKSPVYWTLKSIPELSGLPRRERGRAWRAVCWKAFRHWEVWVAFVSIGVGTFLGNSLSRPIGGVIGGAIGVFAFSQVAVHFARPYLRDYLLFQEVVRSGGRGAHPLP
jgi:hypothetical protein